MIQKERKFLTCLFQMVSCTLFAVLVYGHFATKETRHQPIVSSNFRTFMLRELSTLNGELTGGKTSFSGERTSSRCMEVKDWVCFVMWFSRIQNLAFVHTCQQFFYLLFVNFVPTTWAEFAISCSKKDSIKPDRHTWFVSQLANRRWHSRIKSHKF